MENMIDKSNASSVVDKQLSNTETNLYNGFPFAGFDFDTTKINAFIASNPQLSVLSNFIKTDEQFVDALKTYLGPEIEELLIPYGQSGSTVPYGGYTLANLGEITAALSAVESDYAKAFAGLIMMDANPMAGGNPQNLVNIVNSMIETKDYNDMLSELGYVNKENPTKILIYPKDFEAKDIISEEINSYNSSQKEEDKISYSDMVGVLMSSVTTIVNAISYVLIAFVAISLIVSSIMIGIITYISVLERTKEIGILRAIGASKKDVSRVFNAETLIVGFGAGLIGILVSLFFILIINIILHALTDIAALSAVLPFGAAVILILISMALTLVAGLIPSRVAAKKDPVIALRTE
jgi:putative ABC transport system permease protein